MPKTMTETNDVKNVAVPSVKPFPPGLARPDQTRDWATSLLSAVAAAGLTHISNARLPPGKFDDLYDAESLVDPPELPEGPSYADICRHKSMCDSVRQRRAHNARVKNEANAYFKTKNHEFFLLVTDSMIVTHPGLRELLRERCKLDGSDTGLYDGVAADRHVHGC